MAQGRVPRGGRFRNHLPHQVAADQARTGLGLGHQPGVVEVDGGQDAFHGASGPQPAHQRPGVDPFHADDAPTFQIAVQIAVGPEIAHAPTFLANDEPGQVRLGAFHVFGIHSVVANLGVGHRHDLSAVARIGEDLLISGHRGVEADFALDFAFGAKSRSRENGSVLQREFRDSWHSSVSP